MRQSWIRAALFTAIGASTPDAVLAEPPAAMPKLAVATPGGVGHYADVNGLHLYYETHGRADGVPLVLIHGGGSSIEVSFAQTLPILAKTHRILAIDEQAHGRTRDIDRPVTFENTADDIAALLAQLDVPRADVFGFSNGATTALQFAIRHPERTRRVIAMSGTFRRDGMPAGFFESMQGATLEAMPKSLQDTYRAVSPWPDELIRMFTRDRDRMIAFRDIPDAAIAGIAAPVLVIVGDRDVVSVDHALRLVTTLKTAQLAVLPATDHAQIEARVERILPFIEDFLAQ